jgi:AraC-like DNA-binding protein
MYAEQPPDPRVADAVLCGWERGPGVGDPILVLPDGCTDIVWRSDGELFVAGPDTGPVLHPHAPGYEFVGLRLRSGAAASVLGVAVDELRDARTPLHHLWSGEATILADRLESAPSHAARRELLADSVAVRLSMGGLDDAVLAATRLVTHGSVRVGGLADAVGLPARTFYRRFVDQVGYAPKFFERVVRFRRFLDLGSKFGSRRHGLAALAATVGYADQAHLSRDCRTLADRTPTELLGG